MKRAIALGAFDGLHIAHMAVLDAAARFEGCAHAVLLFDQHPQQALSGCAPPRLLTDEDRDARLRQMGLEILSAQFNEVKGMCPRAFFEEILLGRFRAAALCCGYDYRFGAGATGTAEDLQGLCEAHGIALCVTPQITYKGAPVSSTRIRLALEEGRLEDVAAMLGQPFGYAFPVVQGDHIGRTLGAPTINQIFPSGFAVPQYGVYISQTCVRGAWHASVTNIGTRPSFTDDALRSETYIPGFSGDLYGQTVPVRLIRFLRPEQKFESLAQLKAQIARDAQIACNTTFAQKEV